MLTNRYPSVTPKNLSVSRIRLGGLTHHETKAGQPLIDEVHLAIQTERQAVHGRFGKLLPLIQSVNLIRLTISDLVNAIVAAYQTDSVAASLVIHSSSFLVKAFSSVTLQEYVLCETFYCVSSPQ